VTETGLAGRSRRKKNTRTRRYRWVLFGLLGVLVLFGLSLGYGAYSVYTEVHEPLPEEPAGREPAWAEEIKPWDRVNVLLLGVDAGADLPRGANRRTDTMIVASFDPETRHVGLLSIPRDTRVDIPGHGFDKVAHAHAYGGPALAMRTVAGFLDVPLHYYVRMDFQGFERIVDTVGGVEIDVPRRMYYEDPVQGLKIDLQPGLQTLDGDKALQFVRFRQYPDGDIGRVQAQQKFMEALIDKAFRLGTVLRLPALATQMSKCVETNMSLGTMIRLAKHAAGVEEGDVAMAVVPGRAAWIEEDLGRISYYVADPKATEEVVARVIRGYDFERNARITVEVLNSTDTPGLAGKVAQALKEQGYVIARVGNAEALAQTTSIVGRENDGGATKAVAVSVARMSGTPSHVTNGLDDAEDSEGVDVRVVLGGDFPIDFSP